MEEGTTEKKKYEMKITITKDQHPAEHWRAGQDAVSTSSVRHRSWRLPESLAL